MGGAVSAGEDNDHLVDNLVSAEYIRSEKLVEIFRAVDRGHYYLKGQRSSAYHDIAWKFNHLHLSAPCIYSKVMEHLELKPGMSFFNLGSGTGYLSTMAGLMLGANGINHGIEIHADVVDYAREKLKEFIAKSPAFDRFEFCEPQFTVGNCLLLPPDVPGYDRVYCGAACPPEYANYLMNLLNIGGKLVLPLEDQLQIKTRTGEQSWESESALAVSFAYLITPNNSNNNLKVIQTPQRSVASLQELCRFCVRREIRKKYKVEMPPKKKKKKRERHHSLGIEEQIVNRRKIARQRLRRRINTTGGSSSRNLRRRRNTTGDSDRMSGSGDSSDDESDSDKDMDTSTTVIKEENKSSNRESRENSPQGIKAESNDISSDTVDTKDKKNANTNDRHQSPPSDEPMDIVTNDKSEDKNETKEQTNNSTRRTHFRFLRRRKTSNSEKTREPGEGQSSSDGKTRPEGNSTNRENSGAEPEAEGRDRRLVHSLRSGRLVYALMRGLSRISREQGSNEGHSIRSVISTVPDTDSESENSSENSSENEEKGEKNSDSESEPEELFAPLPETAFTIAIRKLPLPQRMISFLLYHRQ